VVELLRLIFNLAMDWEKPPPGFDNPAQLVGKRKGAGDGHVKRYQEEPRTRWLNREEISYLLEALAEETDIYAASAIRLLLYTGLRKSELLAAKWEHLDLERGALFVPERKGEEDFTLPLNSLALKELTSLPRQQGSPWIFPSDRNPEEHRRDVKRQWDRVREKTGLEDIRIQDLRRTAGSWMAQAGVPLALIQDVLGQQSPEVVKVYARLAEESARAAVDRYASALDLALKGWSDERRTLPLGDRNTADQGIEFPGGRLYPIDLWLPRHK
jgi:integrase